MKKAKFGVMLLLLMAITASAQVKLGLKGGFNLSDFNQSGWDIRPNISYGVMMDIGLIKMESNKNFGIHTGIMMNNKGARTAVNEYYAAGLSTDHKYYISPLYFDIPLNISYSINLDEYNSIYFSAGPYFSLLVGGKFKSEFVGDLQKFDIVEWLDYKRTNYGLGFEVGYYYEGFQFSLGYELGLGNVAKSNSSIPYKGKKYVGGDLHKKPTDERHDEFWKTLVFDKALKHRVIKLSIGYFFQLK